MSHTTTLAFNLFADIEAADTSAQVAGLLIDGFDRLGFNSMVSVKLPGPNESWEQNLLINTRSERFSEAYFDQQYESSDPVLDHFRLNASAFTWMDAYKVSKRETAVDLYRLTTEHNMRNGLVVPVLTSTGGGIVSASCLTDSIDQERFSAAHLIALYAGTRMLTERYNPLKNTVLHQREYQCLQWVAVGKTDSDIADILSLSPNTVRNYIESAKTRLGAPNRTAAVVSALKAGLLSI